jgi:phosphopantothenoylcysteine decarboxylase/phosphopantothenate--cysteine ligase
MHPSDDIRGSKSNRLSGKKIVLAVAGSIAAVETIKLARELIRHGVEIIPVMSSSAAKIIHPDSLWFATGKKPIVELSGATEHVSYCGRVKDPADLLLICPCTANTISKIAHGVDDTSVTTFATTAIGSNIPILIVPAMHLSMYDHKIIQENIKKCKTVKIKFIEPNIEKNKAKMPNIDEIVANVIRLTGKQNLFKKKILVIGGPTTEPVDDVRVITNRSSGKTAVLLAKSAFYQGSDVELWYGRGYELVPEWIKKTNYSSLNDLLKLVKTRKLNQFDIIIVCAAISDYIPKKQKGKIPSRKEKLVVEMDPAPRIIPILRKKAPKAKIVGFKVEEKKDKIKEKAMTLLKNNKLDLVIGNTISGFSSDENEIWIFNKKGKSINKKGKKEILTDYILDLIK